MLQNENIQSFYKTITPEIPANWFPNGSDVGHFNVFPRWRCRGSFGRRDFYKIVLVLGTGTLQYGDSEIMIDRPALFYTSRLVPYSWIPISEQQDGWFCVFTEDFLHKNESSIRKKYPIFRSDKPVFFLDELGIQKFSDIFRNMVNDISSDYEYRYDMLHSHLHLLIHEGQKLMPKSGLDLHPINAAERITYLFLESLEKQFPIDSPDMALAMKTPHEFAEHLSVHTNHLNHSVKKVTGKTLSQIISGRIAEEATALLQNSNWTIADIAYALGFEYPSHFTKLFKKYTGLSPKEMREV